MTPSQSLLSRLLTFVSNTGSRLSIWRAIWAGSVSILAIYSFTFYLLPLAFHYRPPIIPLKSIIEVAICAITMASASLMVLPSLQIRKPEITIQDSLCLIQGENSITGTSCLEIESVPGSVYTSEDGSPRYNESMLLALRAGMETDVNIAFEAGVEEGNPFMRIFITAHSRSLEDIQKTLRREATRTEAILLASLNAVELSVLKGDDLHRAILLHRSGNPNDGNQILFQLRGKPKVLPGYESSQIGTFMSTLLKQGYSASITCVFSAAKAGREKKQLEGKWRAIQAREKRKEESLSDHAEKKRILSQYEEIEDNVGWFDASSYLIASAESSEAVQTSIDGIKGLVMSIWGDGKSFSINQKRVSQRIQHKLISRQFLKKEKMHSSRLVSFVNTPVQKLPRMHTVQLPEFPVPPRDLIEHELGIGRVMYGDRQLSEVGLDSEWLREHVAVLGATGTGKTTIVKHIISQLSEQTDIPWWIFDVKGSEYSDLAAYDGVEIIKPGLDSSFTIDLLGLESGKDEGTVYSTFVMLRELLKERSEASELSPAMEKLLRDAIVKIAQSGKKQKSGQLLIDTISSLAGGDRIAGMTRDALLNRLEILTREPLGSILGGGSKPAQIAKLLEKRVIFDLRHVARTGGMESARLLYNIVAKQIFDSAMKRGIVPGLHHVVVLEEASNLVPESYARHSAADVTTGESMVMLQRATGQGVIVVSTRPNISSNILANTSTKIVFRLPYDSQVGAKFLSLSEEQELYLRSMKRGRALVSIPQAETFQIATEPFIAPLLVQGPSVAQSTAPILDTEPEVKSSSSKFDGNPSSEDDTEPAPLQEDTGTVLFDRIGHIASHVVAHLASVESATEKEIRELISTLDTSIASHDVSEILRDLVSLGTIERETISLVTGGVLFTLPDRGAAAIRNVILNYIIERIDDAEDITVSDEGSTLPDLILGERAVLIMPEHLKSSSMRSAMESINKCMAELGTSITELFIVVRGSVAAAKMRELLGTNELFDAVTVVSAFQSSIDTMLEVLNSGITAEVATDSVVTKEVIEPKSETLKHAEEKEPETKESNLLGAMHDVGTATSRAVQIRLWFGLIQDFVSLSSGLAEWEMLLDFIETTALQSLKGRTAPLTKEEGRRALTELLADEVLTAVRVGDGSEFEGLEQGLWIVNSAVLEELKRSATNSLKEEFNRKGLIVHTDHGYYDFCVGDTSYVVFPNQQQLNTLLNLHSEIACRKCESSKVVCILTASEYLEDEVITPGNLLIATLEDNVTALAI